MQCAEDPVNHRILAVFYGPGSVNSSFWGEICVNQPLLLSVSDQNGTPQAYVCRPDGIAGSVDVSIAKSTGNAVFSVGSMAGSSVEVSWK